VKCANDRAPSATRPRDSEQVIADTLNYLATEEACGASHVRIDTVRTLLRIPTLAEVRARRVRLVSESP